MWLSVRNALLVNYGQFHVPGSGGKYVRQGVPAHLADGKFSAASWNALDFDVPRQCPHAAKRLETLKRRVSRTRGDSGQYRTEYSINASGVDVERRSNRVRFFDERWRCKHERVVSRLPNDTRER